MKKKISLFFALFVFVISYSQIKFEKGYIINNQNIKTNSLIKNTDWKYNPTQIKYKNSEEDEVKIGLIKNIKEFGIDGASKYIRADVNIDRSSKNLNFISRDRNPKFTKETLFLKVLIEGNASLYEYVDGNLYRYFYKIDNQPIEQLVYKPFLLSDKKIGYNENYKQQILKNLPCPKISINYIKKLNYYKSDLVKIFTKYNTCKNTRFTTYEPKKKSFVFSAKIGINSVNFSTFNKYSIVNNVKFENKLNLRIGAEVEYILPFNNTKWRVFTEPTLQKIQVTKKTDSNTFILGGKVVTNIEYTSLEIPIGLRYYLFLNKKSKLFVNVAYNFPITFNSKMDYNIIGGSNATKPIKINPTNNKSIGVGYKKDNYSVEVRMLRHREILAGYAYWVSTYDSYSLILGYTIF